MNFVKIRKDGSDVNHNAESEELKKGVKFYKEHVYNLNKLVKL